MRSTALLVVLLLCRVVASIDSARDELRYLLEGASRSVELSVEGVLDGLDWLSMAVSDGTIEPKVAIAAAERAKSLGMFAEEAGALLNNAALRCRYGGCDERATFRSAVEAAPNSTSIALNFAYYLEQRDDPEEAARILAKYDGVGIRIAAASLCPPHASTKNLLRERYSYLLGRLLALASQLEESKPQQLQDPATLVGSMPIAWPYIGYAYKPLAVALGRLYRASTPAFNSRPRRTKKRRVAIVAELGQNTSPGILFERIFEGLCLEFDVVFVAPASLDSPFAQKAKRLASRQIDIDLESIAAISPDLILFLAVGLSTKTYTLALARLAPVQIAFGHGHPITSGLADTIDYFVSSVHYQTSLQSSHSLPPSLAREDQQNRPSRYDTLAADAAGVPLSFEKAIGPRSQDGVQDYAEQLVLFDSRTVGVADFPEPEPFLDRKRAAGPLFACLQHSKKLHPDFDDALFAVLEAVPNGTVMMLEGTKTHLPRWNSRGIDTSRIQFVERNRREVILGLVQAADAFLDTYPWGGGVTVLESLSVCTPPIVLASKTTVLQLALGHLKAIDLDRDLVAANVREYASIARRLAYDSTYRRYISAKACAKRNNLFDSSDALEEWIQFITRLID